MGAGGEKYQIRYQMYCKYKGGDPETMFEIEGDMIGFMMWIQGQWRIFDRAHGTCDGTHTTAVHKQFDEWLVNKFGKEVSNEKNSV